MIHKQIGLALALASLFSPLAYGVPALGGNNTNLVSADGSASLAQPALAPAKHPCLMLTPDGVDSIRTNLGKAPLFDAALADTKASLEKVLNDPPDVPVPKDASGPTQQRHARNESEMRNAGFLYQVTGDSRYAAFVKSRLESYAALYPTLGVHPASKENSPGRLFWQPLNEANWLVDVSQAYDCIYNTLTPEERSRFETNIFRPMVQFISEVHGKEFNIMHNHATWFVSAVGMAGYVMGDETIVKKALYGSKMDGSAGFFRQMEELFSPDGYYCEGPYYARYALMPFFIFAEVIQNNQPELKVFERHDQILKKSLFALLQQTDLDGNFFPLNDSMKEMNFRSGSVIFPLNEAYARYGHDPSLLSVVLSEGRVSLDLAGQIVALGLTATPNPPPFSYVSVEYSDGPDGSGGGLGILRSGLGKYLSVAVLKYTSLGMGHGHYDKLALEYYDQGREILTDYGSVRFVNVEQKYGGRYLPENNSYAKQTIAHNTVVVDESSHYRGNYNAAKALHSDRGFFDAKDPDFQVMSATDTTAVPGVAMRRTVAMVRDKVLDHPVLVDVFLLSSEKEHLYDYPFHFMGQFMESNLQLTPHLGEQHPLGEGNGYQHLWVESEGAMKENGGSLSFTWLDGNRYYTITSAADPSTRVAFTRTGANDPNFNLRHEPAMIMRQKATNHVFASAIEPHGSFDGSKESTSGSSPIIRSVTVLASTKEGTVVRVIGERKIQWTVLIANDSPDPATKHSVKAGEETFSWDGPAKIIKK
jgi:hypothetical protein